jgi:hypothetical protein
MPVKSRKKSVSLGSELNPHAHFLTLLHRELKTELSIFEMFYTSWIVLFCKISTQFLFNEEQFLGYQIKEYDLNIPFILLFLGISTIQYTKNCQHRLTSVAKSLLPVFRKFSDTSFDLNDAVKQVTCFNSSILDEITYTPTQLSDLSKKLRNTPKKNQSFILKIITFYFFSIEMLTIIALKSEQFHHAELIDSARELCMQFNKITDFIPFTSDTLTNKCITIDNYEVGSSEIKGEVIGDFIVDLFLDGLNTLIKPYKADPIKEPELWSSFQPYSLAVKSRIDRVRGSYKKLFYNVYVHINYIVSFFYNFESMLRHKMGYFTLLIDSLKLVSRGLPAIYSLILLVNSISKSRYYVTSQIIQSFKPLSFVSSEGNALSLKGDYLSVRVAFDLLRHVGCYIPNNPRYYKGAGEFQALLPGHSPLYTWILIRQLYKKNLFFLRTFYQSENRLKEKIKAKLKLAREVEVKLEPDAASNIVTVTLNFSMMTSDKIESLMKQVSSSLSKYNCFKALAYEIPFLSWEITSLELDDLSQFLHDQKKQTSCSQVHCQETIKGSGTRKSRKAPRDKQLSARAIIRNENLRQLEMAQSTISNRYTEENNKVRFEITRFQEKEQQIFICDTEKMMTLFNDKITKQQVIETCFNVLRYKPTNRAFNQGAQTVDPRERYAGKLLAPSRPTQTQYDWGFSTSAFKIKWNSGERIVFQKIEGGNFWLATSFYSKSSGKVTRCYDYNIAPRVVAARLG